MLFSIRGRPVELIHARAFLAFVQVVAIAWFSPGRGLPLDDAWIHQVVARTFAETGTLGYAPGQHGAAATSYLWAALLAFNFKLLHLEPSRWALILNSVAALATGQFLFTITDRARPFEIDEQPWRVTTLVATLFACISPNILWFVCSGMEAMPFAALSLGAIAAATSPNKPERKVFAVGFAAGALALLRPEAAPLGGILVLDHFVRTKNVKRAMSIAAPWLTCVAVYVGSNLAKTGHALPSTLTGRRWLWFDVSSGLGRADRALDFLDAWNLRLGSYTLDTSAIVIWILFGIATYGALRIARGQQGGARMLVGWALFHAAFYALLLPTPGHGGRYQPLTPLVFALCLPLGTAMLLRELARLVGVSENARFAWFALAGILPWVAMSAPVAASLRNANALAVAHIDNTENAAGLYLNTLGPGAVASFDIGRQGFVAKRRLLDLGGLSDPAVGRLLEAGRISSWLEANDVKWIVLPEGYETVLPEFEDYQSRLHLRQNGQIALLPLRVFETPFEKWQPGIKATWNAAPKQVVFAVAYPKKPGPRVVPLVDSSAHHEISDPSGLVPRRDLAIAEHMLATLDGWDFPLDLQPTPVRPSNVPATHCTVAFGGWGFATGGCPEPAIVQSMLYEQGGRYLAVGDLGGALRVIPHLVAMVKRRSDPTFHPPLAPVVLPVPGGAFEQPATAGRFGLALFALVLALVTALDLAAKRGYRLRRGSVLAAALALPLAGCGGKPDVGDAMRRGRGAVAEALDSGADANHSRRGVPLLNAARGGESEVVALLLEHGASLDARDPDNATALQVATRGGHLGAMALLEAAMQARGKSLDEPAGARGRTALEDATSIGSLDAVTLLANDNADPNVRDAFGETALHLLAPVDAPRAGPIARALLAHGADPTLVDLRGFTPLHAAAMSDNVGLARVLARLPLLDIRTPSGETPLDVALRYHRDRVAEVLLAAGSEIGTGIPPLHDAARMDAIDRIGALLAIGADTDRQWDDVTAFEVAKANHSTQAIELLREPGQ